MYIDGRNRWAAVIGLREGVSIVFPRGEGVRAAITNNNNNNNNTQVYIICICIYSHNRIWV